MMQFVPRTTTPSWPCCLSITTAILLLLTSVDQSGGIKWLALTKSKQGYWNRTVHCVKSRTDGLVSRQVKLCKQNLDLMSVIAKAARDTMGVCQELFIERRWNCSSVVTAPNFTPDLGTGTREQAYVYALSSASLAQNVARACSLGVTTKCSCGILPNEAPPGDFKWGGCGDDLRYGIAFSRFFADSAWTSTKRQKNSKSALMNLHNNMAGRRAVKDSLTTACKCHGVSGSCSIKTCWKALPDLLTIGKTIQKRYAIAVEVARKKRKGKKVLVPINHEKIIFREDELVYYTISPDYCSSDRSVGSMGTRGRICKKSDQSSGGCQSMCCGRGYVSNIVTYKERCDCKYYWCCYVKCKTCIRRMEVNRCV